MIETTERESLADHLEAIATDASGCIILLHLGADKREIEAELNALIRRTMLIRVGLLAHEAPERLIA